MKKEVDYKKDEEIKYGTGLPADDLIKDAEKVKKRAIKLIAKAKQIHEYWLVEHERIEREAKANDTWQDSGFDANNHLFKELDAEVKEKLEQLKNLSI